MTPRRALALLATLAAGCPAEISFPGDTLVGTFKFTARCVSDGGCGRGDAAVLPEDFTGLVSYNSQNGNAYLASGNTVLRGDLSGNVLTVSGQALRGIPSASCEGSLSESIAATMHTEPEASAAGFGGCLALAELDGGAQSLDGGLDGSQGDAGLRVQLICGTLTDKLSGPSGIAGPSDGGSPDPCWLEPYEVEYSLEGRRQ
jgi:hypothetical protein